MKRILLTITTLFLIHICFAQISEYQHPITIMGQYEKVCPQSKPFSITIEDFLIHDMDSSPYSHMKIKYLKANKRKAHYRIEKNQIIPEKGFHGILHVRLTIDDGTFETSPFDFNVQIGKLQNIDKIKIYVSNQGDDKGGDGSFNNPLQTLDAARLKLRNIRENLKKKDTQYKGAEIILRGGEYFLNKALLLGVEDSGTKDFPIAYKAYKNEHVLITGSVKLDMSKLEQPSYQIRRRIISPQVNLNIRVLDLKKQSLSSLGLIDHVGFAVRNNPLPQATLFQDGKAWHIARYPNTSNFNDVKNPQGKKIFTSVSARVDKWQNTGDIWIDGALTKAWEWQKNKIATIKDSLVTMVWDYNDKIGIQPVKMFYFNILEELDYPKEYFIDTKTNKMYLYLDEKIQPKEDFRLSYSTDNLIKINSANYLTFENLEISGTRNTGIIINNGTYNTIINCEIHSMGCDGVNINGDHNVVKNSSIHDIGGTGISLRGGIRNSLQPALNRIENCIIHDFAQQKRAYHCGIAISGVGQIVTHSELYNGPHMAMKVTGINHLIEYSDFHNSPCEYSDMLGIYFCSGNSMFNRGTIIRRNKFHDVNGTWKQSAGVYLDNETAGVKVEENYFYDNIAQQSGWSVMIHGGCDNQVLRNVFVYCSFPFNIYTRLNGYAADKFEDCLLRWQKDFQKNMNKIWAYNFPELNRYFDDEHISPKTMDYTYHIKKNKQGEITNYWDRRTPDSNVFSDNLIYNESQQILALPEIKKGQNTEIRDYYVVSGFRIKNGTMEDDLIHMNNHNVLEDPGFANYKKRDLRIISNNKNKQLLDSLPYLKNNYFEKIGINN